MYVTLRQLRHRGVPLPATIWKNDRWTEGRLQIHAIDGARGLGLFDIHSRPDVPPMAVLYEAKVSRMVDDALVLRGIERVVQGSGEVAAVVQEWAIRSRTCMEPKNTVRPDLPNRDTSLINAVDEAAGGYVKPGRSGASSP